MAKQLCNQKEEIVLYKLIRDLEKRVLEKDQWFNKFTCYNCFYKWKTMDDWIEYQFCPRCKSKDFNIDSFRQTLYHIEFAMESNADYGAFFERYGFKITRFDVESRLNDIKTWVFQLIKEKSAKRRFKRFK